MAILIFRCLFRKSILEIIFMEKKIKDYLDNYGILIEKALYVAAEQSNGDTMGIICREPAVVEELWAKNQQTFCLVPAMSQISV